MATRGHPGRPWEQRDGHEVVRNMIFIDFGVILEPVYVSFLTSRRWTCQFFRACFQNLFLYRFLNRNVNSRDSRFEVFAYKVLQKTTFHQNRFLSISKSNLLVFWRPWEPIFRFSCAFKTSSKTGGFFVVSNVLFKAPGPCQ